MRLINFLRKHKKISILLACSFFIGVLLSFILLFKENDSSKITGGLGSTEELKKKPGLVSKELLPDGSIKHTFSSSSLARNTVVITKDDKIVYQRIATDQSRPPKLTEFTNSYGQPEEIIDGYLYGEGSKIYVYPRYGFSITVNPATENVLEEQIFEKTTLSEYKQKYEEDLFVAE